MARGGKREGAGRPRGQRNAATKEQIAIISDMAKMHSDEALAALVEIATNKRASEGARVSAANAILDRAWGKPVQGVHLSGAEGGAISVITRRIIDPADNAPGD